MTCPSCGAQVPEGARFCSSCGFALAQREDDQRRVVTVLFADLVGFTTMSEGTDPEQVKRVVDGCFEELVGVVETFGGRVDKIIGDAVLALFGAPVGHEDDAERAVRAALRMQETLASRDTSAELQLRIGVNTGEVLVGALRSGGDYTAMGDVVNTAQRLQSAARPGQVLVGSATYLAAGDSITYESLGPLRVRGRGERVEAWRALDTLQPPGRRNRRVDGPLVG
ncbi:MAG: adenylate/guanylate cyclase domain-containing protein, partial [Actinomycetota bacterium]